MNPVKDRFYYVYILQSLKNSRWYTGYTYDLRKRFNDHQNSLSSYTKGRGPFKLIYYEASLHEEDAMAREKYLKNRLKRSLSLTG